MLQDVGTRIYMYRELELDLPTGLSVGALLNSRRSDNTTDARLGQELRPFPKLPTSSWQACKSCFWKAFGNTDGRVGLSLLDDYLLIE